MTYSLDMDVEFVDGQYIIDASWLKSPVIARTFHEAYWIAVQKRTK